MGYPTIELSVLALKREEKNCIHFRHFMLDIDSRLILNPTYLTLLHQSLICFMTSLTFIKAVLLVKLIHELKMNVIGIHIDTVFLI